MKSCSRKFIILQHVTLAIYCYTLCKSFHLEEFSKRNIVQSIRAVENNTLFCYSFCQVFCCFCLSSSSRSLWGTTKMQMKSTKQCPDIQNKPLFTAHLICLDCICIGNRHNKANFRLCIVETLDMSTCIKLLHV